MAMFLLQIQRRTRLEKLIQQLVMYLCTFAGPGSYGFADGIGMSASSSSIACKRDYLCRRCWQGNH
jgi:hypothetical protein